MRTLTLPIINKARPGLLFEKASNQWDNFLYFWKKLMPNLLPGGITYEDDVHLTFEEIDRRYGESELGMQLVKQVRYDKLKLPETSTDQWCQLLGADVNNYRHLRLTLGLAKSFLRRVDLENLTVEDLEVLMLTAVTHDWAEAITMDIDYDKKGQNEETAERDLLAGLLHEFIPEDKRSVNPRAPRVLETLYDRDSKLWLMFNLVEKIGYIRTGINAYRRSHKAEGEQAEKLNFLGKMTVSNHAHFLLEHSERFPALLDFFRGREYLFEEILGAAQPEDFQRFVPGHEQKYLDGLAAGRERLAKFRNGKGAGENAA